MRSIVGVGLVAVAFATAIGCGGMSEEEKRAQARQERVEKERREARRERAREQAAYDTCADTFTDLQDAVSELNSRLDIGLNYQDYGTAVADVKVAYDQTGFDDVSDFDCLGDVGLPLERALNQYFKASETWDACFDDIECDIDSVDPELQEHWAKASAAAERSESALEAMQPE